MSTKKTITLLFLTLLFISNLAFSQSPTILFVLSSADSLELNSGEKIYQTGVFLNEFYYPYKSITSKGFDVAFATPGGIKPTIDEGSLDEKYWKNYPELKEEAIDFWNNDENFSNPMTLESAMANLDQYMGMVVPGGQGLMVDLIADDTIPTMLKGFAESDKAIGLICHAPALLTTIPKDKNPFTGFKVNSVTYIEELFIETIVMGGRPANRKIARQLKELGLQHKSGFPGSDFAVRDRNLVTSQNPYSGRSFVELFIPLLQEKAKDL